MDEQVESVVNCAIDCVNELLPDDEPLSKERDTVVLGPDGRLDSMGFVNLVAAIEEQLEKQFGIKSVLGDELMKIEGALTVGELHEILQKIVQGANPRTP